MDFEVDYSTLNEDQQLVVDIIGMDNFIKLAMEFPATFIYFPSIGARFKAERNQQIIKEYDGRNYRRLALKFGLSERYIRTIVSAERQKMRNKPVDGQQKFF